MWFILRRNDFYWAVWFRSLTHVHFQCRRQSMYSLLDFPLLQPSFEISADKTDFHRNIKPGTTWEPLSGQLSPENPLISVCVSHSTSITTTSTERRRSSCAAGRTVRVSRSPSKLSTCWWFTCADTRGRNHTSARWVTDGLCALFRLPQGPSCSLNTSNCTYVHIWIFFLTQIKHTDFFSSYWSIHHFTVRLEELIPHTTSVNPWFWPKPQWMEFLSFVPKKITKLLLCNQLVSNWFFCLCVTEGLIIIMMPVSRYDLKSLLA